MLEPNHITFKVQILSLQRGLPKSTNTKGLTGLLDTVVNIF